MTKWLTSSDFGLLRFYQQILCQIGTNLYNLLKIKKYYEIHDQTRYGAMPNFQPRTMLSQLNGDNNKSHKVPWMVKKGKATF
jgi:hypothetical protein